MGVPGFFSWLIKRYPLCLQKLRLGEIPRLDCLYLDMNGILYKCGRDESTVFKDLLKGKNMQDIFVQIFNFISELVAWVNPQKKIFLGFDGPAPRAKQNQQRSRRFKSAKGYAELNDALQNCGFLPKGETFKNNSISPGTEFMHELNKQMEYFILRKFKEDERWQNLEIIFSGSNVPGEGEHKLLSHIRQWTAQPDYDPLTTHCIYGCDADLIMLGLATHVKYISIIRENFERKQAISHAAQREKDPLSFDMIYLNVVRQYMQLEFQEIEDKMTKLPFQMNRIIDDFILICFFIGNDFLPRCYCFDIREGNLEEILDAYQTHLQVAAQYINNDGIIDFEALQHLIQQFSDFEAKFIKDRSKETQNQVEANNRGQKKNRSELDEEDDLVDDHDEDQKENQQNDTTFNSASSQESASQKPNKILSRTSQQAVQQENSVVEIRELHAQQVQDQADFLKELTDLYQKDEVQARRFFYQTKMKLDLLKQQDIQELHFVIQKYIEGLQFVLLYYFRGCPSWTWYFPYYYAPMTSDILKYLEHFNAETKNTYKVDFDHSQAYPPLQQLMCILHTENSALLPQPFAEVVLNPLSPFRTPIDYFPNEFEIDPYGALMEHEYIAVIPIPPQEIVTQVYESIDLTKLTQEERDRNQIGESVRYLYNPKYQPFKFDSLIPHVDATPVQVPVLQEVLQIQENSRFMPKNPTSQTVSLFPSLHSLQIESGDLQNPKKPGCKNRLYLNIETKNSASDLNINRKQFLYCFTQYPNATKARVIGFINKDEFQSAPGNITFPALDEFNYNKKNHQQVFEELRQTVHKDYHAKGVLYQKQSEQTLVFLHIYPEPRRNVNGDIRENILINDSLYVPLNLISFQEKVQYPQITDLSGLQLEQEFKVGSPCVILRFQDVPKEQKDKQKQGVFFGYVQSVSKETQRVTVIPTLKYEDIQEVQKQIENSDSSVFYSVDLVAKKLRMSNQALLSLLDNLTIFIDTELPSSQKLSEGIDIGLNLINRRSDMIVPSLVRIHNAHRGLEAREKYMQYNHLEISQKVVHFLTIYSQEHPNVIACIEKICALRNSKAKNNISVQQMFPTSKDPNLELVKVYVWIMKQDISTLMLSPINSTSISPESVQMLEKQVQIADLSSNKYPEVELNPNFVCVPSQKFFIIPSYSKQPEFPRVGDRVVNLNNLHTTRVPFGLCGTVIARIQHKFEVVFDSTFIGGTTLGGQCSQLRGGVLEFRDIYLINGQSKHLILPRDTKSTLYPWDGKIDGVFVPQYKDNVITTEKQIKDSPFEISEEELKAKHEEYGVPDEPPIPKDFKIEGEPEEERKNRDKFSHHNQGKFNKDEQHNKHTENNQGKHENKPVKHAEVQNQKQPQIKTENNNNNKNQQQSNKPKEQTPQIIQQSFEKPSIQQVDYYVPQQPGERQKEEKKTEEKIQKEPSEQGSGSQKVVSSEENFIYIPQAPSSSSSIQSPIVSNTSSSNIEEKTQPKNEKQQKKKLTKNAQPFENQEIYVPKNPQPPQILSKDNIPSVEEIEKQLIEPVPRSIEEIEKELLNKSSNEAPKIVPVDIAELEKQLVEGKK